MNLHSELIKRYGLTTKAPSVDDLVLLMARVERLESKVKLGALYLLEQVDNDETEPDWEKIRALAITVRDNLLDDIGALRSAGLALRNRVIAAEESIAALDARITALEP